VKTEEIADIEALLKKVASFVNELGGEVWWRGQSDANWGLVPSVYRGPQGVSYEQNIALRFVRAAPTRYVRPPARTDTTAWIQLMQHFRLPTRLLDWTQSPLIGLYFAVAEPRDAPAALWALGATKLNDAEAQQSVIFNTEDGLVQRLIASAFNRNAAKATETLATFGEEMDLRMALQLAAFTIHGTKTPLESHSQAATFLRKLIIPASEKERLRRFLWLLGIRRSNLFPDLENLAQELSALDFDP